MVEVFPAESPFRVDQVMEAPWLTGALFVLQVLLAALSTAAAKRRMMPGWLVAVASLLAVTAVFFSLATWGTSDVTKLNFVFEPARETGSSLKAHLPFEPLWWWMASWIPYLPYRMAGLHGLIVAGFAAIPIVFARSWSFRLWSGWLSLLIVTSPFMRGFFQNGHTRQSMATLLLMPLFLSVTSWSRWRPWWVLSSSVVALGAHLTALPTLFLSVLPSLGSLFDFLKSRRLVAALVASILLAFAGTFVIPIVTKLQSYGASGFFSSYPVKVDVIRCQLVMVFTVAIVWMRQRLTWKTFWAQREAQALTIFMCIYVLLQATVLWRFWPQVTFRLGDPVGMFLILSYLSWLRRRRILWMVLPLLGFSLISWADRVFWPQGLACGLDDDFLCVPDRWPWNIHYPTR